MLEKKRLSDLKFDLEHFLNISFSIMRKQFIDVLHSKEEYDCWFIV